MVIKSMNLITLHVSIFNSYPTRYMAIDNDGTKIMLCNTKSNSLLTNTKSNVTRIKFQTQIRAEFKTSVVN